MAGLAGASAMLGAGRHTRDKFNRLLSGCSFATIALIMAQPLGLKVQARLTTSGDPGTLEVTEIKHNKRGQVISPSHTNARLRVAEEGPAIYIFDGDDEFAIKESIDKIRTRLGDATIAEMNTTRLDGRSCTLPQLQDALATIPFLAPKRLVILTHPTHRWSDKQTQESFLQFLSADKPTAKLILVEYDFLTSDRDRNTGNLNWLEKWALTPGQEKRVFIRHFAQPSGAMMVKWIQDYARLMGGQFTPQAAVSLVNQIGDDTQIAVQEVGKLLTYVNFSRAVDADDVEHLTL
jgi:DNA polymerase-3 subunit delta